MWPSDRSQTPRPRLLTIYYKHKPGGLCKRLYALIEAMLDRGWEVHYIAAEPYPLAREGLKPHILPLPFRRHEGVTFWFFFLAASLVASAALALTLRPALLVSFHPAYAAAAWPARVLRRVPLVLFVRSDARALNRILGRPVWLRALDRVTERAGFRAADCFVFVSEVLRGELGRRHRLRPERCVVLPNELACASVGPAGRIEARRWLEGELGIAPDEFVVATSGTLNRGKNVPLLIEAFRRMAHTPRVLLVVGDGVDLPALKRATAGDLQGPARIVWAGWRADAVRIVAGVDLFVLPTLFEGMSNALLEAIGLGVPVLASDIPANREVLGSDDSLFALDGIEDLAEKADRVIASADFRMGLGRLQAERAAPLRFDWKQRVADFLEGLVSGR